MKENSREILYPRFADLLLDSMADGVFALDENGQITLWNSSMENITGYKADEAKGKTCEFLNFNHCMNKSCPPGFKECGIYKYGKHPPFQKTLFHGVGSGYRHQYGGCVALSGQVT